MIIVANVGGQYREVMIIVRQIHLIVMHIGVYNSQFSYTEVYCTLFSKNLVNHANLV